MILAWMAYAALCAALFALAAACVDGVFTAWRRARRAVWMTAMLASIVVPFALPLMPGAESASQSSTMTTPAAIASEQLSATSRASVRTDAIVLGVWGVASVVFALTLLFAHRQTRLALRQCRRGVIGGRPAFISNDFGPAVVGVLRPHIVVPSWALSLDETEQTLVVAHEVEHARAGDPILALVGVTAVVLMPWNAALWWQLSHLRLAIELDCDARVIAGRRGDALAYSQLLLSVGERGRATRHPVLAMSRSRSSLAKRFDALLRRDAVRPRRVMALAALSAGIIASVAFVPAPSVAGLLGAFREQRAPTITPPAPSSAAVAEPVNGASFSSAPQRQPAPANESAARATVGRVRRTTASFERSALPPVSVVPSNTVARGLLDSVVPRASVLPPSPRRAGGMIMARPAGTLTGGAFGPAGSQPTRTDSNAVIRSGGRGGRAVLIARPDSTRPPQ